MLQLKIGFNVRSQALKTIFCNLRRQIELKSHFSSVAQGKGRVRTSYSQSPETVLISCRAQMMMTTAKYSMTAISPVYVCQRNAPGPSYNISLVLDLRRPLISYYQGHKNDDMICPQDMKIPQKLFFRVPFGCRWSKIHCEPQLSHVR